MMLLWLLLVSWCSGASLQRLDENLESYSPLYLPTNPIDFRDQTPFDNADFYRNDAVANTLYQNEPFTNNENYDNAFRKNDILDGEDENNRNRRWVPDLIDVDKTQYTKAGEEDSSPLALASLQALTDDTSPEMSARDIETKTKRNFSPWGGKRDPGYGYRWSWKRTPQSKENNMPKRVRFSPWGGKRSGNAIHKPNKVSRIIYNSLTPEGWLHRFNGKYQNEDLDSFPFKTTNRKKYHLLKFKRGEYDLLNKNHMPFFDFARNLYSLDTMRKKDGKRKVKFSSWGGKRSLPIIGPVWSPSADKAKDKLNSILIFDDEAEKMDRPKV